MRLDMGNIIVRLIVAIVVAVVVLWVLSMVLWNWVAALIALGLFLVIMFGGA